MSQFEPDLWRNKREANLRSIVLDNQADRKVNPEENNISSPSPSMIQVRTELICLRAILRVFIYLSTHPW